MFSPLHDNLTERNIRCESAGRRGNDYTGNLHSLVHTHVVVAITTQSAHARVCDLTAQREVGSLRNVAVARHALLN